MIAGSSSADPRCEFSSGAEGLVLEKVAARRDRFQVGPLSLQVARGELLWLTGPNGAGKSTLLLAIAGLCPVAEGEVRFGGRRLSASGEHGPPWRRGCSILLQEPGLWPHLSIRRQCLLVAGRGEAQEKREDRKGHPGGPEGWQRHQSNCD